MAEPCPNKIEQFDVEKELSQMPVLQSSSWKVSRLVDGLYRCQFDQNPPLCVCISQQVGYGSVERELVCQHCESVSLLMSLLPARTLFRRVCGAFSCCGEELDGCLNEAFFLLRAN